MHSRTVLAALLVVLEHPPLWQIVAIAGQERLLQAMAEKQEENAKKSFQTLSLGSTRMAPHVFSMVFTAFADPQYGLREDMIMSTNGSRREVHIV